MRRILRRHLPGVKSIHSPTEVSYTRAISKNASLRYSVDLIAFKFTIDKRTESMVTFRVLSRTNFVDRHSSTSSISFASFRLRTLHLSCRSFHSSRPLFSTTSGFFLQNTGGGIPLRDFFRCTEAQKCLSVTPLLATLTHSVSRKSFPCHSYANTRDGGVTVASVQCLRASVANPAPRLTSHSCTRVQYLLRQPLSNHFFPALNLLLH